MDSCDDEQHRGISIKSLEDKLPEPAFVRENVLTPRGIHLQKTFFRIGDETRFCILYILSGRRVNVGNLAKQLGQSQPAISHHLDMQRKGGLISFERHGKNNDYALLSSGVDQLSIAGDVLQSFRSPEGDDAAGISHGRENPVPAPYDWELNSLTVEGQEAVAMYHAAGQKTILRIFFLLRNYELSVSSLCQALHESQPAVSHHLKKLRESKILAKRQQGKNNFYSFTEESREKFHRAGLYLQNLKPPAS